MNGDHPMKEFVFLRGHTFLRRLDSAPLVVDIGANHGAFSRACVDEFGARTILVEANPDLAARLRETFPRVEAFAVSGEDGTFRFNISDNHEASSLFTLPDDSPFGGRHVRSVEVPTRQLDGFLRDFGPEPIALLKMDIEGGEFAVLRSLRGPLRTLPAQITVEFHSSAEFGLALAAELEPTLAHMRSLGFIAIDFTAPRHMDVLFVNPEFHGVGLLRRFRWSFVYGVAAPSLRALRFRLKLRSRLKQLLRLT